MTHLTCPRCLGAGVIVTFDGKGGYCCPTCCPPHMRKSAIELDCMNELAKYDAIDTIVDHNTDFKKPWWDVTK